MEKIRKEIKFKAESFRKIPNPFKKESEDEPQMYLAMCNVREIPQELLEWMETNPREQNVNSSVAKKIKNSLLTNPDFHLLNRGLLLSSESVSYSNYDGTLTIVFSDHEVHGNVDGGHTLRVILDNIDNLDSEVERFVKIEIITGAESIFENLAEARNTSVQVKDSSIGDLKDYYEGLKQLVVNEPFANNISYKENADGDIDIGEILALLNMFNKDLYKDMYNCPVISYSSKKKCIDYFLRNQESVENNRMDEKDNPYYKMTPIIIDIFKIYDRLECGINEYYRRKYTNGQYGRTTGVTTAKSGKCFYSKFYKNQIGHSTPNGFIYPIVGAFRALVEEHEGLYRWKKGMNPLDVLEKIGAELVSTTVERSRTLGNNPNKVGKDNGTWQTLYMQVMVTTMDEQ